MPAKSTPVNLSEKLIDTAIQLLAEQGPSAIQVRSIAKLANVSTMAVYSTFGGMPELLSAVAERGFDCLVYAFKQAPKTGDPVCDIFILAMTHRAVARKNPHLYDLMFGLSTRGVYRAIELGASSSSETPSTAYQATYLFLIEASRQLVDSGRVRDGDPTVIAAQLWSYVHGFISLELAGHLNQFNDPVQRVLLPLGTNMVIGLGDSPEQAQKSITKAVKAIKKLKLIET